MVQRDVTHDNYIRRPKERGMQVGKEGASTPNSDCPLGVLPWELIKSGTRVLQGSYPLVTLPYNTGLLVRLALSVKLALTTSLSISTELSSLPILTTQPRWQVTF